MSILDDPAIIMNMYIKLKSLLRPYKQSWRQLRQLFVYGLRYLPITSEKFGPPKGFYERTLDWMNISKQDISKNYIQIYPKLDVCLKTPKTIYESVDYRLNEEEFFDTKETKIPSAFVAIIKNGRVCGSGGSIITPDDKLLFDLSMQGGLEPENHTILQKLKLPKISQINETVAVLATWNGQNNYFHWMFDGLPRISLLKQSNLYNRVDKFIVNKLQHSFQKESLEIIGIPREKIIEADEDFHVKADTLVVPSFPSKYSVMPLWVCEFLRKEFLLKTDVQNTNKIENLYITRKNAAYRQVLNEDEVIKFLNQFNFVVLDPGNFSMTEQALIFADAKIIISPHGAALTNLVFSSPGTKVLEIFAPRYVQGAYRVLCNQANLDYYYLLGKGEVLSKNERDFSDLSIIKDDIVVDINSLSDTLKIWGLAK